MLKPLLGRKYKMMLLASTHDGFQGMSYKERLIFEVFISSILNERLIFFHQIHINWLKQFALLIFISKITILVNKQ